MPDGLHRHRRPPPAAQGVQVAARLAEGRPQSHPGGTHREDGRSQRASWPVSSGWKLYREAGGSTRADLFGNEVYLEKPALLQRLAEEKLGGIRKELEAEGWGWVEINPERDYDAIHRCGRLKPQLIGVPADLVDLKSQLGRRA